MASSWLYFASITLVIATYVVSLNIPSIVIPTTILPPTSSGSSLLDTIGQYSSGASNLACEVNPTGLLCNTSVSTGHKIIQNLPADATIRPCSVFLASPHCCAQFCPPGVGGRCDLETGACFCNPSGVPNACQLLLQTETYSTDGMNSNDLALLGICKEKCKSNPNNCTKAAAATDGIVGTVCFCYC
ncbi:uncharacterized protein LOC110856016 [Folsomia candida]|uniref:Uncharacterized protein n=1 Tax=Folsomia candida TaxID=158441 RepID=A0A226DQY0_FOLCA|nr:uncharacterized protein LOC110856016 [Folsomia candida]OXA47077.1 hypothetical protein Fcan01_18346 [Folsomia candida]